MARQNTSHIDDPSALGRRLRQSRVERGLTQSALVFEGCTIGHVSRIEAGLRTPSLQVVRRLAEILSVDEHWLATGTFALPEPAEETMLRDAQIAMRLSELGEARVVLEVLTEREGELHDSLRARLRAARGQLAYLEDRTRDAVEELRAAFEADPALGDPEAAETLGRAHARLDQLPEAIDLFRSWLARAEEADDPAERLRFGVLLANALVDADELAAATDTLARIGDDVASGDPLALARIYWTQSRLQTRAGDAEAAVELARRTLVILDTGESQVQRARAYQLLAYAELAAGRPEEALGLVASGRHVLGALGTRHDRMVLLVEEARALVTLGRLEEGAATAMEAVGMLPEDASRVDLGRAYTELATAFDHAGDHARAREIFELAEELVADGPRRYREETARRFGDLLERLGEAERAAALRAAVEA